MERMEKKPKQENHLIMKSKKRKLYEMNFQI